MEASGQLLSGIVRVGATHRGWKTPYEYAITWSAVGPETAFLHGLVSDGGFTSAHRRAVAVHLKALGFKWGEWSRMEPDGTVRSLRFSVERFSRG